MQRQCRALCQPEHSRPAHNKACCSAPATGLRQRQPAKLRIAGPARVSQQRTPLLDLPSVLAAQSGRGARPGVVVVLRTDATSPPRRQNRDASSPVLQGGSQPWRTNVRCDGPHAPLALSFRLGLLPKAAPAARCVRNLAPTLGRDVAASAAARPGAPLRAPAVASARQSSRRSSVPWLPRRRFRRTPRTSRVCCALRAAQRRC